MFGYQRDPEATGVGVAFTSAALDLGDNQPPAGRLAAFSAVAAALGVPVAIVSQVHGAEVAVVGDAEVSEGLIDLTAIRADALVTTRPGVALAVRVADCVPILLADAAGTVVAAAHAGREGLFAGVIGAAVEAMRDRTDAAIEAWVGPHICAACYEVPPAMAADAASRLGVPPSATRWGTTGIDLGAAARQQLEAYGVRVTEVGGCTLEDERLPSHRGGGTGRMAGVVWLRGPGPNRARRAGLSAGSG